MLTCPNSSDIGAHVGFDAEVGVSANEEIHIGILPICQRKHAYVGDLSIIHTCIAVRLLLLTTSMSILVCQLAILHISGKPVTTVLRYECMYGMHEMRTSST